MGIKEKKQSACGVGYVHPRRLAAEQASGARKEKTERPAKSAESEEATEETE